MAFFGATIETIIKVIPHPDAERLDLGYMDGLGFQLVLPKGSYHEGEKVVYFPNDSVIPENILVKIGLAGKLSGKLKNRLKIGKRIRGEYAEGLCQKFSDMWEFMSDKPQPAEINADLWNKEIPACINDTNGQPIDSTLLTKLLGVMKYEPPEEFVNSGSAGSLPDHLNKYDIESTDREKAAVEFLMDKPVVIAEKMEGQNFAASVRKQSDGTYKFYVCSRTQVKFEPTEAQLASGQVCTFWKMANKYRLKELMIQHAQFFGMDDFTLYAEQCGPGIQGNIYQFGDHRLFFFDAKISGRWANHQIFEATMEGLGLGQYVAPRAVFESLGAAINDKSIDDIATGPSSHNHKTLKEGIVIKPLEEVMRSRGGRLILKKRSLAYLEKSSL
jgi:RNA ligase (TIGR02306 family)